MAPDAVVGLEANRTRGTATEDGDSANLLRTEVRWQGFGAGRAPESARPVDVELECVGARIAARTSEAG